MRSDLAFYLVAGVLLILLLILLRCLWRMGKTAPVAPKPARAKRDPKPFAGYTRKPECELCNPGMDSHPQAPGAPPPRMLFTQGRSRHIDTTGAGS